MRKCQNTKVHNCQTKIGALLIFGIGICCLILSIGAIYKDPEAYVSCSVLLVIGVAICTFSVFLYAILMREYSIATSGIVIRYLGIITVEYSWSDISHICVCDVNHAAKNSTVFDVVIRLVIGSEKHGPSNCTAYANASKHVKWRKMEYSIFHFRNILLIDYSEPTVDQILKASNLDIDYLLTNDAQKTKILSM
ncbi:MAG: hypothetical protein IJW88_09770 [Alistipes sp.]|nr:hypothetical protein [Alistipes sp.]